MYVRFFEKDNVKIAYNGDATGDAEITVDPSRVQQKTDSELLRVRDPAVSALTQWSIITLPAAVLMQWALERLRDIGVSLFESLSWPELLRVAGNIERIFNGDDYALRVLDDLRDALAAAESEHDAGDLIFTMLEPDTVYGLVDAAIDKLKSWRQRR